MIAATQSILSDHTRRETGQTAAKHDILIFCRYGSKPLMVRLSGQFLAHPRQAARHSRASPLTLTCRLHPGRLRRKAALGAALLYQHEPDTLQQLNGSVHPFGQKEIG